MHIRYNRECRNKRKHITWLQRVWQLCFSDNLVGQQQQQYCVIQLNSVDSQPKKMFATTVKNYLLTCHRDQRFYIFARNKREFVITMIVTIK
jgi:hypothetical protein